MGVLTLELLGKLSYVLVLVIAGICLNWAGQRYPTLRLPVTRFFRFLHAYTIIIILPVVVFFSIARYSPADVLGFSNSFAIGFLVSGICFVVSVMISKRVGDSRERTVALALNSGYMNVTYLGFPVIYAVLGSSALGPAALYAMGVGIPHVILGTVLLTLLSKRKVEPRALTISVISFPAVFALIAALLFVVFSAPLPSSLYTSFDQYVAPVFFTLMLLLVGYQTTITSPKQYKDELLSVGAFRFVVSPVLAYVFIVALGLDITRDLTPKPALLQSSMPPAVFNLVLAHNFKRDTKLYGALMFYPTLFFLFVVLPLLSTFLAA